MMRIFKFRAWDKDNETMTYSEDCNFYDNGFIVTRNGLQFYRVDSDRQLQEQNTINMQFTGVQDSAGIDIYEGDILKGYFEDLGEEVGSVVFEKGFQIKIEGIKDLDDVSGWLEHTKEIEIIGNIYENPELL